MFKDQFKKSISLNIFVQNQIENQRKPRDVSQMYRRHTEFVICVIQNFIVYLSVHLLYNQSILCEFLFVKFTLAYFKIIEEFTSKIKRERLIKVTSLK